MEKTGKLGSSPEEIAKRLTKQYADHGFCINISEAKKIGLNVGEVEDNLLDPIWELHETLKKMEDIRREQRGQEIMKVIDKLPPEILEKIRSKADKSREERTKE
jgi:hypothetical protein